MYSIAPNSAYSCPACGCKAFSSIPYPAGNKIQPALHFATITICEKCELGVAKPKLSQSELDAFYESGAYWSASASSKAQLAHERNQSRHRVLHCLPHFTVTGVVADIGAGHGAIAEWLERLAGKRVVRYDFIEPDFANRKWILGRHTSFPIACADSAAELCNEYSLLFLNHVLEHVADPYSFLGNLCSRLRPGGIAYIETPHSDHQFKGNVFPHTLFFTLAAFRHLAARLGLEVIECESFGAYPGSPDGIHPRFFKFMNLLFHLTARGAPSFVTQAIDDEIWRYRPLEKGIWLRCILRRPI